MWIRIALLYALTVTATEAAAQPSRGYAGGAMFVSTQDSHRQGEAPSLPRTGVGGATWGVGGEAGWYLTPSFTIGVEFVLPARIESIQETDYFQIFQTENRYRDLTIATVARVSTPKVGPVRLGVVGGWCQIQESTFQRSRYMPGSTGTAVGTFGPWTLESTASRWTYGGLVGADLEVAAAPHVSVVPQFRMELIRRSQSTQDALWYLGLSSVVFRPGVAVRATF